MVIGGSLLSTGVAASPEATTHRHHCGLTSPKLTEPRGRISRTSQLRNSRSVEDQRASRPNLSDLSAPKLTECRGSESLEALLKAAGVALLGASQSLEPVGDLGEALFAGGLGEARVHLGVLVGLTGDRRLEVGLGVADGLARRGVADLGEVLQVAVSVTGLVWANQR